MGGHRHLGWGIVVHGWGIAICGQGIAFCGWDSSLSVGSGACHLLWFEHHSGHSHVWWAFAWVVGMMWWFAFVGVHVCGGLGGCGPSHRWWAFKWLVGACHSLVEGRCWMGHCCGGQGVVVHGFVGVVPLLCGQGFMVWLRKPSSTWHTPSGCATSAAWWWALLLSLVIPGVLGFHHQECCYRRSTPRWACHISCLVVGVMVGVCIVVVAMAEAWDSGGLQ